MGSVLARFPFGKHKKRMVPGSIYPDWRRVGFIYEDFSFSRDIYEGALIAAQEVAERLRSALKHESKRPKVTAEGKTEMAM